MKLHWSPKSPYVRKVMICAHELGIVGGIRLHRSVATMAKPNPELMRDHPLSKIPALLLDDGRVLVDSVVICEYLDTLAQGTLFPASADVKWRVLSLHALADGLLDLLILWRNERERPADQRSQALLDAFAVKASATLARLEMEAAWLASTPLSIAHVAVACALGYMDFRFAHLAWREHVPALAEWHAAIESRPAFAATLPELD